MLQENTEKLDLPSISQVPTRGQSDVPFFNNAPRPAYMPPERLSLPPVHAQQAYSSSTGSPPGSSLGSSISSHAGSQSSYSSAATSLGAKTPPTPSSAEYPGIHGPVTTAGGYEAYPAMNQAPQDPNSMYYPQAHINGSAPPPVSSSMSANYPPSQQQPLLQPQYGAPHPQYAPQQYGPYVTSPPSGPVHGGMAPNVLPLPGQPGMPNQYSGFDTTGQVAPPGMKPRVTATLWEDEGSLCFQVEARGICVARREGELYHELRARSRH